MKNLTIIKMQLATLSVATLVAASISMTPFIGSSYAATTLEATIESGLPVPTQSISKSMEQTPYLATSIVMVKADVSDVAEFYRTEMAELKWQEEKDRANVSATTGELHFKGPEGTALLLLAQTDAGTQITLSTRSNEAAIQSGLMAPEGKTKIIFGNFADGDAIVKIDNQTVKIAAHAGEMGPDGPKIDLKPGAYTYKVETKGQEATTAELVVGGNEIWSVMVGQGGLLPMKLY